MSYTKPPRDQYVMPLRHILSTIAIALTVTTQFCLPNPISSTNQTFADYNSTTPQNLDIVYIEHDNNTNTSAPSTFYDIGEGISSDGPDDQAANATSGSNSTDTPWSADTEWQTSQSLEVEEAGILNGKDEVNGHDALKEINNGDRNYNPANNCDNNTNTTTNDNNKKNTTTTTTTSDNNMDSNDTMSADSFSPNNETLTQSDFTDEDQPPNINILTTTHLSTCEHDLYRLLTSLANDPWAIPFLDSWGKVGPSLTENWHTFVGNYDQCHRSEAPPDGNHPGFKGEYCIVKTYTPEVPIQTTSGLCFPDSCSSSELQFLLPIVLASVNSTNQYGFVFKRSSIYVQCMNADTQVTTATVFASIIITTIVLLVTAGTTYDYIYVQTWQLKPPNSFFKSIVAFSAYTNGKHLFRTSTSNDSSIDSIHGIRFLSMSWIIMGHVYFNGTKYSINEQASLAEFLSRRTFDPISNTYLSVDTFFTMSGLLVSYLTLQELSKKETWKINWAMFYFHRIWRLTPAYMVVLVTVLGFQQYMGDGPLWSNDQPLDKSNCEDNWWTNLLYINNIVNPGEMCMTHSWYLANDMQFYLLSPLFLIPFYFGHVYGFVTCSCSLLVSMVTTAILSVDNDWPTSELVYPTHRNHDWFTQYYIKPWNRIGPFVVGILAGYILIKIKGKQLKLNPKIAGVGWVVSAVLATVIIFSIHGDYSGDNVSDRGAAATYNALHRTVWAGCVSWLIVACEGEYGWPVGALLSWAPFKVFGKLTYVVYLVHPSIISVFFQNLGLPYYANDAAQVVLFLGICVLSYSVGLVCSLLVESPMVGLEKVLFRRGG